VQSNLRVLQPWNVAIYAVPAVTLFFLTGVYDPFNLPKLLVLMMVVFCAIGVAIGNRQANLFKYMSHLTRSEKTFVLLIIFFILSYGIFGLISTEASQRFFWGASGRNLGFLYYFSLVILVVIITLSKFNVDADRWSFHRVLIFAFIPLASYSFLQVMGWDPIEWNNPYDPMLGTLGNPNFSSALLGALSGYFLVHVLHSFRAERARFFNFALFAVSTVLTMLNSSTQGKLLTLSAIILLAIRNLTIRIARRSYQFFVLAFIFFLSFFILLSFLGRGPFGGLLLQSTIPLRFEYWKIGILGGLNNPVTGVGVDSYQEAFRQYRSIEFARDYSLQVVSDNAHNWFINLFATSGFATFIFLIAALSIPLFWSIKNILFVKNVNHRVLSSSLFFLLLTAQALISIEQIGLGVWFWVLMALLSNHSWRESVNELRPPKTFKPPRNFGRESAFMSFIVALLFIIPIHREETQLVKILGMQVDSQTNPAVVDSLVEDLSSFSLTDPKRLLIVANAYLMVDFRQKAILYLESARRIDSEAWEPRDALALIYGETGSLEEAVAVREEMAKLDPNNWSNLFELARVYEFLGEKNRAKTNYERVVSLAPSAEEGLISSDWLSNNA
jgi:hypothetical protein